MLKGITVVLHERIENGKAAFNRPVYTENDVAIKNVLVAPASEEEIHLPHSGSKNPHHGDSCGSSARSV